MDCQEMYQKNMRGSLKDLVKGGLVYQYFRQPFFVWCTKFAPKEEKDPESAYMSMILGNGRRHEDEVCKEMYPGGIDIDPTLHEKAFLQSLEGMFRGEKFVKNGIYYSLPQHLVAVPDVLVKVPGRSAFGDWQYEVVEIKSSKHIREEHIMQAAYYNYIMGIIQGVSPETFIMIDGQKEKTEFRYAEYRSKVLETIEAIRSILAGRQPRVEKVGWPWESFSARKLEEQKGISLIPNLWSSHRQLLEAAGVETLNDFFSLNILRVEGISFDTLDRYRKCAKAILQGRHAFMVKPFLPEAATEIFMDFEGVEGVWVNGKKISGDYLIGALIRENGKESYEHFVAESLGQEHEMLLEFLKFLRDLTAESGDARDQGGAGKGGFVIYHFGSYEKSHLAGLLHTYGIDESFARKVLDSMVDICQVARKSVIFPTHSYSLKELGKYLGFQWRGIGDAKDSIALFLKFLKKGEKAALEKIITYNEDDCIALKRVKDFLVWGT